MKKYIKFGIAALTLGAACALTFTISNKVSASAEKPEEKIVTKINYDDSKDFFGTKVIKGKYSNDATYDMYYSDGFFKTNPNDYQPHMATLACQLTHASTTYINGNDYSKGDKQIREALETIGFDSIYTTDTYTKKPTVDSIACAIAKKDIKDVKDSKYKYAVDITVRSANYEAEWANNVKLGKEGEAEGFGGSANKIVANYLPDFLKANPKVEEALNKGEVAFFVNGYSRGGATANIAAKKLCDTYQAKGNAVYAYCIEAPQGGVATLEKPNVDYGCIHNVINQSDLVCYVGPKKMGFKRYGVDHYLGGTEADSKNLKKGIYFEAPADNTWNSSDMQKKYPLVKAELKKLLKRDNISGYEPTDVDYKELDARNFTIKDVGKGSAYAFIETLVDNTLNGKTKIDRNVYTEKLQKAASNIMEFLFKDPDFKKITIDSPDALYKVMPSLLAKFVCNVKVYSKSSNPFVVTWQYLTNSKELKYDFEFTDSIRKTLAEDITNVLTKQESVKKMLDEYYPTKAKGALEDIKNILLVGLSGSNTLNTIITAAYNIKGLFNNHATLQTLAWLHLEDSWYFNQAEAQLTTTEAPKAEALKTEEKSTTKEVVKAVTNPTTKEATKAATK